MIIVIALVVTVVIGLIANYFFLPAFTFASGGFWLFIICLLAVFWGCIATSAFFDLEKIDDHDYTKVFFAVSSVAGAFVALFLIVAVAGSPLFNAFSYANTIKIEENDATSIPTVENLSQIPLMDTNSAKKLGDRTVGSLTDVVSQYNVSSDYTTITYKGRVYKIAPLEYAGFFKYDANKFNGIPGYVLVDTENNSAEYVKLEEGFKFSPSAFWGQDLTRALRTRYKKLIFSSWTFQIDEEGLPYWIATVSKPVSTVCGLKPVGAVVMNAITGDSNYYDLSEVPEWVDYIVSGDMVSKLYNWHGFYQRGFWNSQFSQQGVTQTTDDFGYISKDNDIWVYTGVTSVNTDESNLGFIMVNSRTNEFFYIPCDGAEEYSAMSAAQGAVQNYGYIASFPALISIEGEPTYAMVLKDANGLIKQYAFVNVKNYTIVSNATTLEKAHKNYVALLRGETLEESGNVPESFEKEEAEVPKVEITEENGSKISIVVERVEYCTLNGNTYVYLFSNGKCYKQALILNENILFVQPGDTVNVLSANNETLITDAVIIDE